MIIENLTSMGQNVTSSLSGGLTINEATGEITIRNQSRDVVKIDKTGFRYFDVTGTKRISIGPNEAGQEQIIVFDATGKSIAIMGQDPKDGSPVVAVSEDGTDVLTELINDNG